MCNYADQQGKPLVVSNSWGSQIGPHDGTGDVADVYNSLFGDNHPNRVALFAASNDAGRGNTNGEGYHISGTASSANPLGSILRCHYYSDTEDGYYYQGIIANGWSQSGTTTIKCKIYVLNRSTGAVLTSVEVTPTTSGATVSGLGTYYSGTLYAYKDYVSANGKTQIMLYTSGLESRSYNSSYVSNYTLAVEFYPQTGSATIDVWGGNRGYFSNFVTTQGHNWRAGSDDMSVSDEATIPSVISIGAYVTKNQTTSYNGTVTNFPRYTIGDIAYFSSYAIADQSPTGLQYPWITAPGARLVAGVNHNHTTSVDNYSYYGNNYNSDLVVNSSTNPYAAMEGTSMATPAAAGIVALWMQASLEANAQHKNLTVNDVKEIMRETAITDSYTTTGANASHFGNGKINALGGIQYILGLNGGTITVDPTELTFGGSDFWTDSSESKTVVVTNTTDEALLLTIAGLNASLSGTPFSVTAITSNGNVAANGGTVTITITYAPTVASASDQATLVIADGVTVALNGSCIQAPEPYDASVYPVEGTLAYGTVTTGNTVTKTITITNEGSQSFTPVVNVSAPFEANYDNSPLAPGESRTITVTFTPTQEGDYSEQLTITASESSDISFNFTLTGTGEAPYIAATVSPQALDFTDRVVGNTYTATVTIANTGTMVFTPVINTDDLPGEFTVTGTGEVLPDGTLDLTVTYSPTDEGPHNGSFTVTIGDQTYTITVTGNGLVVNSTLYSAVVDVPVYKTDIEILSPYTMAELEADTSHDLPANVTNSDVNIKVTSNSSAITRYDVYHNVGVKESQENWATGDLNRAVSYASADYDSYVYLPHAKDEDLTSWVQQPSVPMSQSEMWIHLNDYVTVQGNATWYVPVVVANGVQSIGNTYGAPIRSSQVSTMTATVNYDQSDIMTDAATGLQYYYMAAEVAMHCVVPPVDDDADYHYELVLARAWRQWTPYVVGQGALPATETYMGQKEIDGAQTDVIIGCKDFQRDESGRWSYDEPTFCALAGTTPLFVSRFYYQRVPNDASAGAPRRAGGGGGGGGGGAGAPGDGPNPPGNATGLGNFTVDKQIVSVTYVNPLGMTSTSPFDGMNIIVTRYDDGSVQTTKVLK